MKPILAILLLASSLIPAAPSLHAQAVSFQTSTATIAPGDTVAVSVSVSGFTHVTTVQFSLQWDRAVLAYMSVQDYALPGLGEGNFGIVHTSNGKLTFSWDDPNAVGVTRDDDETIFTVHLVAIGTAGTSTVVEFADSPTPREVSVNYEAVEFASSDGVIQLTTTTTLSPTETLPSTYSLGQNFPNPFASNTALNYNLPTNEVVRLVIIDVLGRTVATLVQEAQPAGEYTVVFDAKALPSGLYYAHLSAGAFSKTRAMTLLN